MGDKQIHAPHGIGAHQNQPSGDAVHGSQVADAVTGAGNGAATPQGWEAENAQWMKDSLQKGLDGELERIENLEAQREGATGAQRDAIDQALKSHRDYADLLRRQAKERGWVLSENSPGRVGRKILKAAAALVGAAVLLVVGLFVSRALSPGELVADTAPGVGTVVEPVKSQDSGPSVAQSDPEGAQVVDGRTVVIVEPVHTDETETQTTTSTEVTYEETEPVHEDSMQTSDQPMYEEPADEGQYDDSEDGGYDEDESDCC